MSQCNHNRKNITLDALQERVRAAGMKITQQRLQLLEILLNQSEPISADEIFKRFNKKSAGMDLVTIYRILKKFEEVLLVSRMEFGDGIARFELSVDSNHHHHHVICRSCQKVEVLHLCELDEHLKKVQAMGYAQVSHRLDFFGLCTNCQSLNG